MTIEMVLRSPSLCIPVQFTSFSVLKGEDGVGVPKGGRVGQVLKKASDADFDTEWQDDVAGGGGTIVTLDGVAQQTFPADTFVEGKVADAVEPIEQQVGEMNADLQDKASKGEVAGKLDKVTSKDLDRAYIATYNGGQSTKPITTSANEWTIPQRGAGGAVKVGKAIDSADAVPLAQMNEALTEKADTKAVDTLSKKVDNLWAGQAPDMFFDDNATAYVKEIPEDVAPYAAVKSVGGMIHAHQLPPPNLFKASVLDAEQSKDGINFWIGGSGVYSVSPDDYFSSSPFVTTAKFKEIFPNSVVGKKYTLTYDAEYFSEAVYGTTAGSIYPSGTFTLTNEIWESGLQMGVAAHYEQADTYYGETQYSNISLTEVGGGERYLTEAKVTALDFVGKNLFDCANAVQYSGNGILVSQSANSMVVQHKVSGETYRSCNFPLPEWLVGKTVTVSGKWTPQYSNTGLMRVMWMRDAAAIETHTAVTKSGGSATFEVKAKPSNDCVLCLALYTNAEGNGYEGDTCTYSDIQLEIGDTATAFSPYHKTTFPIPPEVQNIDGYGYGLSMYKYNSYLGRDNTVEFDEGGRATFVKRTNKKVYVGTENWSRGTYNDEAYFVIRLTGDAVAGDASLMVTDKFPNRSIVEGAPAIYSANHGRDLIVVPEGAPTTEQWKAQLAAWNAEGKPLTVYYDLLAPIVTDISHLITEDNLIPVQGGGVIVAHNENEEAAPTTIRYQVTGATLADAFDQIHEYAMQKIGGTT